MSSNTPVPAVASQRPQAGDSSRLSRTEQTLLGMAVLAILVTNSVWAFYLLEYGVDIPRMDQFDTPGKQIAAAAEGELDFSLLIRQHNESRKLVPSY